MRFVVDAVPEIVIAVDEANGIVDARPSPRIVVVAVRPTKIPSSDENCVDDALLKSARASAVSDPELSIEKSDDPAEFKIEKRFAV